MWQRDRTIVGVRPDRQVAAYPLSRGRGNVTFHGLIFALSLIGQFVCFIHPRPISSVAKARAFRLSKEFRGELFSIFRA